MSSTLSAVAAVLVAATTGVLPFTTTPAGAVPARAAAVCAGATGVTVVVDYNEVGGPTRAGCDPGGAGHAASDVFPDAGFPLEFHPRQPGYVCKVTGVPDDRPCLENDSFWSLWWSDGRSGEWRFANQGVGGLSVPDGGYLAFSWHEGSGRAQPPDHAPTPHQVATTDPPGGNGGNQDDGGDNGSGDDGNGDGDGGSGDDAGATSGAPTTTAATEATSSAGESGAGMPKGRKSRAAEAADPTSEASGSTVPGAAEITAGPPPSGDLATDTDGDDESALATWIGIGLAAVVLGAAGVVTVVRRRAG